jgi:DNA-binding MarR family transcriptional regulator
MQAANACVEAGLEGTELTVRMRAVLEILRRHGDQTVPDIAARLEIKRQYVQLMVNEVLAGGFVEQRANPSAASSERTEKQMAAQGVALN